MGSTIKDPEPGKIRLEVIDNQNQHFMVSFDRPGRVEVSTIIDPQTGKATTVVAHVYDGPKNDQEQDPLGAFDGTNKDNKSWEA